MIDLDVLEALVEAGVTAAQLLAAIKAMNPSEEIERIERKRERDRVRIQRKRAGELGIGAWDDYSDVYFIQAGDAGPIKIGKAKNVIARLYGLQTAHHEQLHIRAVIPGGGPKLESDLHERFSADRLEGEWFAPSENLLRAIREIQVAANASETEG